MKPSILIFMAYYLPGFRAGGPIRTVANMVSGLGGEFDFKIVTLDRDLGDTASYPEIPIDTWVSCGNAMVRYVRPNDFGLRKIAEIARSTPHDVIYLNSFFDSRFTQKVLINRRLGRLCGRPIVIAPRGEFSAGALQIKSWKKSVFIRLAKAFKLYDGLTWQASSSMEAQDIQRVMAVAGDFSGRVVVSGNVAVAADMAALEMDKPMRGPSRCQGDETHPLRVCSLSRISPMKNLDFALAALALVRIPVRFAIYGPIEDYSYWEYCKSIISKLPPNIEVVYGGSVSPDRVISTISQNDLFLFPTRGENFGHVIHEALRAGLAVLVSDQTPWRGLEALGVGWDLPLNDTSAFAQRMEEYSRWPLERREQLSIRARAWAAKIGADPETLKANRNLFLNTIRHAEQMKN